MRNFKNNFRRNRYKNHLDRNNHRNDNGNIVNDLQMVQIFLEKTQAGIIIMRLGLLKNTQILQEKLFRMAIRFCRKITYNMQIILQEFYRVVN